MEWLVSIVLAIISVLVFLLEGKVFLFFLLPAIIFSPIVLDFLYDKGLYISNTIKWILIFISCIIGALIIATKEVDFTNNNIDVINPMDGLVLNESEVMTLPEPGDNSSSNVLTLDDENNNGNTGLIEEVYYNVEYYYDGVLLESATDKFFGNKGEIIDTYRDKSLDLYNVSKTENFPLELFEEKADLTIRVYYVKKPEVVRYVIRYYYDGILDSSRTHYMEGLTGNSISEYPREDKEGYVLLRTSKLPLKLSANESENEIRVYYGFYESTTMEELGLVDGFAPAVLTRKDKEVSKTIITVEEIECPSCGSIYDKELLIVVDEETYKCPYCESEFILSSEEESEGEVDNPNQQKISEKYALDTIKHEIHNPLCYYVRKIPSENFLASNDSIEALREKGYKPCTKCNPKWLKKEIRVFKLWKIQILPLN